MTTPVEKARGIGPKTAEFLKKHRITTIEGLVQRGTKVLAQAQGFNEARAMTIINDAAKLISGSSNNKVSPVVKKKSSSKVKTKSEKSGKKDKKNKKSKDKKGKDKKSKKDKKNKKNKDKKKNKK